MLFSKTLRRVGYLGATAALCSLRMAIDINTFYNPYYRFADDSVSPPDSGPYLDREADFLYKIEEGDLCYQLFTERGYTWGGSWDTVKDYQHFEK